MLHDTVRGLGWDEYWTAVDVDQDGMDTGGRGRGLGWDEYWMAVDVDQEGMNTGWQWTWIRMG